MVVSVLDAVVSHRLSAPDKNSAQRGLANQNRISAITNHEQQKS
jgi:hypothetical protein